MQIIADLQIHSKYSRATSRNLSVDTLAAGAKIKGINVLGTGDCTHPLWLTELKEHLQPTAEGSGIYKYGGIFWMITGEVSTDYEQDGKMHRIHHMFHLPSFEVADQVNEQLSKHVDLKIDGRPMIKITSPEFVETLMGIDKSIMITPAHAWTPWFGVFGSKSGFDSLEECYQDQAKHIFSLETGMSCYDTETEVLTNNGWRKIFDVKYSDEVCTLDVKTDKIVFQKPVKLFKYRYNGKMYKLRTKRIDLLVTPNHKLLYSPCDFRKKPSFSLKEAEFLFNKSKRFKKDGIWIGVNPKYFVIPAVKIRHGSRYYSGLRKKNEKKVPIKPWLKFFGFWLAEGWTTKGKDGDYGVYLANSNSDLIFEMKKILQSFGYSVYQYINKDMYTIRIRDYQLFSYLKQFGKAPEKFIPSDIKSLSKDLLKILFEYYIKGDGHRYGRNRKGLSATTISKRLRDDLQEIALKIGISAYFKLHTKKDTPIVSLPKARLKGYKQSEDSWIVYFIRKNIHTVLPSTVKKYNYTESWVNYDGFVYCLEVPNHVIYVRRNGIPAWCGNSDPAMNWRLSKLDNITLVSNSDAHSANPWRLGREANVFELEEDEITYGNIVDAIRKKDGKLFKFTVETDPNYGKYHFDGHRVCSFSCSPEQTKRLNGFCPRCKRRLTIGVLSRVEQLADRPEGFVPKDAIPFKDLIPLYEIISFTMGVEQLYSKKVLDEQNKLIDRFGNEFNVLLKVSKEELVKVTHEKIADSIVRLREGKVKFVAGYDGVYGKPIFGSGENLKDKITGMKIQSSLTDFNAKGP